MTKPVRRPGATVMISGKLYVAHGKPVRLATSSGLIVQDLQHPSDFYRAESKNRLGKGPWKIVAQISPPEELSEPRRHDWYISFDRVLCRNCDNEEGDDDHKPCAGNKKKIRPQATAVRQQEERT